jgi:glucokinase
MTYHFIGCDLGGTNLRAAVVDTNTGVLSGLTSTPTLAREGPEAVMARMVELIQAAIAASQVPLAEIGGVGVGAPGQLDLDQGRVLFLPNLPGTWPNVPLRDTLFSQLRRPVHLLNDARAMALGEWAFGAGRGAENMACFGIGTGIGGGLILNGRLYLGLGGNSAELGHHVVELNGLPCGCGNRGCVETYASGSAITAMGLKAITQGLTTRLGELVDYDLNRLTPQVICDAARSGDAIAQEIYERAGYYLGVAVGNVVTIAGVSRVVIGGGVAQAGDLLLDPIRRTFTERVHMVPTDQVQIVPAELGPNAGIVGVAYWASQKAAEV